MNPKIFLMICLLSFTITEASEPVRVPNKRKPYDQKSTQKLKASIKKRPRNCANASPYLQAGADPNFTTAEDRPFLHEAIAHEAIDVVKLALENGANPNALNAAQENGLHYQSTSAHVMTALCDAGANVNQQNKWGYTPLHKLIVCSYSDLQRKSLILLLAGADHTIIDSCGRTPEQLLTTEGGNLLAAHERIERASWFKAMIGFAPSIKHTIELEQTALDNELIAHMAKPLVELTKAYLPRPDGMTLFKQLSPQHVEPEPLTQDSQD